MARKFWERVGGNRIQFYDEPRTLTKDELLERIADIQAILALDDDQKAIIGAQLPAGVGSDPFEALDEELQMLADQNDYWDYEQETDNITIVQSGWWSPADGTLGPGTIVSASSELVGAEAIGAIDKNGSTRWETDPNAAPHELRFGWGYKKKVDGIRFRVGPTIDNPEDLQGVTIRLARDASGLDRPNNIFLDNQDIQVAGTHNDPWLEIDFGSAKSDARFCRIDITSTGAGNNRAVVRDIELRVHVRTFGL